MARLIARLMLPALLGCAALPGLAQAQPADLPIAPADGSPLPPGVRIVTADGSRVYADRRGHVLYGMDMRTVLRWAPDAAQYCDQDCEAEWTPLLAPPGTVPNIRFPQQLREDASNEGMIDPRKAPDWTIIAGPRGPQWVYKGWHMVFTRRAGDARSAQFDGAGEMTWNTLKYAPATPKIVAPATVTTALVGGAYVLADKQGHVLFTGTCADPCGWFPLAAPMAGSGIGKWKVSTTGDQPQWMLKGKPVFVSMEDDPKTAPPGTTLLRPEAR